MKTLFEKSFERDLKNIKDKRLLKQVQKIIAQVESATSQEKRDAWTMLNLSRRAV
jgi:hypothetical protein